MLEVGDRAPDFTLPDENGDLHSLSDYAGQMVVLFFYPEDDTPGCTQEACNFRDDYSAYQKAGAVLLGISPDDASSHSDFQQKFKLPFTLLADVDHKVSEQYGTWGNKKLFGLEYEGMKRTTFLIDGRGKIVEVFNVTRIGIHSQKVLERLEALAES